MADALAKYLHDLVVVLAAPTLVLSDADGQVRPRGAHGVLHADVRVLSRAEVRVGGVEPVPLSHGSETAGSALFVSLVPGVAPDSHDPTLRLERSRDVAPGRCSERLTLVSFATEPLHTDLTLLVAADLAPIELIRRGDRAAAVEASTAGSTLVMRGPDVTVTLEAPGASLEPVDDLGVIVRWPVEVPPHGQASVSWSLSVEDTGAVVGAAPADPSWGALSVRADDRRLGALVARSLADLHALRMTPAGSPDEVFLAAGAPWYLTLFGRDSLWAARMLLPVTTTVAASTLRVLAARQGRRVDPDSGEAPGKILHELRRGASDHGDMLLPPVYYGTVDATALWVVLLHDAWRWGLAYSEVLALLPALEAALGWLRDHGDPDGDGFLEYVDESGRGLANQGWKDSADAVRFADGRRAAPPIALCEVQGYAHEAALAGAALLDGFARPGADEWRRWAAAMADRFRGRFWVDSPTGPVPALALDGAKTRVDAVTSNIGHLLGTGLLDDEESARVTARVTAPDLDGGLGLRTMSDQAGGYSPLSYHCGSVWPHDTAIVVYGLLRSGHASAATGLVQGLLAAGEALGYRLPELWSGDPATLSAAPVPYPAACRPQAWSAAAALVLVQAVLGLQVDVPAGTVAVRPPRPSPVGAAHVAGLRVGAETLTVEIDAAGRVVEVSGTRLRVLTP